MTVEGVFQRADTENANKRVYPKNLWQKILQQEDTKKRIQSKQMLGMFGHPVSGKTDPMLISHVVTRQELRNDGTVFGEAEVLDTPAGRIVASLFEAGVKLGISSRGDGSVQQKGGKSEVQEDFYLETYDFVLKPSTPGAFPELAEAENTQLALNALESLVKNNLPQVEEDRNRVVVACKKICEDLEGSSVRISNIVEADPNQLPVIPVVTVEAKMEMPKQEETNKTNVVEDNNMDKSQLNENMLQWHQNQLTEAVNTAVDKKNEEIQDIKEQMLDTQKLFNKLSEEHDAAKNVIEDLAEKVKEAEGRDLTEEFSTLHERHEALKDMMESAARRLPELGQARKRIETLEGLLEASLNKMRTNRIELAVEEVLAKIPENLHEAIKPAFECCQMPEDVEKIYKGLAAGWEKTKAFEAAGLPLPASASQSSRAPIQEQKVVPMGQPVPSGMSGKAFVNSLSNRLFASVK